LVSAAASHRLKHSDDKIYEIAQSLGCLKTSYFIRLFKDHYGLTPQEYGDTMT
jgi:two-component system response regulator YesN